ncbi:hypothetical protein MMC06_001845 [Schaereria dolodes]|nr:hypothetical protein [Schaereria dolodes]
MAATEPRTQDFGAEVSRAGDQGDNDPFAAQRTAENDPFTTQPSGDSLPDATTSPNLAAPQSPRDRRMSKEWDASKVPPSRFQKREGSIYATPGSKDSHTGKGKDRDSSYHEKLKEKGWLK